jgi:hypothetical protein
MRGPARALGSAKPHHPRFPGQETDIIHSTACLADFAKPLIVRVKFAKVAFF